MTSSVSLLPALAALLLALLTSYLLTRRFSAPVAAGRFTSIDGLRGYLAFFVFLHHSCIWYFFLKTGDWKTPPSNVYTNFGQFSVVLFFMITGFLFIGKILNNRNKEIDWLRVYVSRVLRLSPLYFFVTTLLIVVVFAMSKYSMKDTPLHLAKTMMQWYGFTALGAPDINGVTDTYHIVAGVTWSLAYEWLFYLVLPLIALCVGNVSSLLFLAMSFLVVAFIVLTGFGPQYTHTWHLSAFAGGGITALLVRNAAFNVFASRKICSIIIFAALSFEATLFSSTYALAPITLLFLAFCLIAGGNTGFGLFSNGVSRMLGDMAYSIYLLHGLMLFVLFNFVLGTERAGHLSAPAYCLTILMLVPLLVLTSYFTARYIEHAAMKHVDVAALWVRQLTRQRTSHREPFGYPGSPE